MFVSINDNSSNVVNTSQFNIVLICLLLGQRVPLPDVQPAALAQYGQYIYINCIMYEYVCFVCDDLLGAQLSYPLYSIPFNQH